MPSPAVTAQVAISFNPISNVTLHYRVMFNPEITVPMNDSGTNGDLAAGDGTWTGTIPGGIASAGQMIRYYVTATDISGYGSRWPIFANPAESEQYYGTVVADPSVQSALPVACLFVQNPTAADNRTGTSASLFYLNEFYDNLTIYVHGQSSAGWPKKSHNTRLSQGPSIPLPAERRAPEKSHFRRQRYGDKARMHTTLTYSMVAWSGGVGLFSFPIRIQQNGTFWGVEDNAG